VPFEDCPHGSHQRRKSSLPPLDFRSVGPGGLRSAQVPPPQPGSHVHLPSAQVHARLWQLLGRRVQVLALSHWESSVHPAGERPRQTLRLSSRSSSSWVMQALSAVAAKYGRPSTGVAKRISGRFAHTRPDVQSASPEQAPCGAGTAATEASVGGPPSGPPTWLDEPRVHPPSASASATSICDSMVIARAAIVAW
jgi:hypothetical protein